MANVNIPDLTNYTNPDGVNDVIEIYDNTNTVNKKITRNNYLGITGNPVGHTDTQTLSNKTLGNTNTITLKGSLFTLQDASDTTKQANFVLSGITTGTTRNYTLPNATGTLVDLASSQTLTNKTITSPVITGGTYDNGTITVDSISGHTTPTIVTVGGVQMNNGVVNTANAITATSIADGAVQPKALIAGTGSGWPWQSYSPTWTNLTVGNGTVNASYIQTGKTVTFKVYLLWGSTTSVAGSVQVTLPVTSVAIDGSGRSMGQVTLLDLSNFWQGPLMFIDTTHVVLRWFAVSGTGIVSTNLSSTSPNTWTTSHQWHCWGTYEGA